MNLGNTATNNKSVDNGNHILKMHIFNIFSQDYILPPFYCSIIIFGNLLPNKFLAILWIPGQWFTDWIVLTRGEKQEQKVSIKNQKKGEFNLGIEEK